MKKEQFIHVNEAGTKRYYSDREMKNLHREDGPAIEWAGGGKTWYINGKLHREDGPAYEYADGGKAWFIDGKRHREDEFNALMNPVTELTLDEIAEKFGVSVDQLKIKK
mgnify:CR=1 FL=1